ncbi:hypothetical protein ZIOFF_043641 [Zingiber officinale]|uniref:Uncharacterized protein n=1 Tax=Zingiber officinale TaxID=94328 RepID=A0A8J5FVB9_ZINOF|nr:hypothetical protein ZIOFF_043641 [Zingiber officinale]
MSNYVLSRNTQSYRDAVKGTDPIESPSVGFTKSSDYQGPTFRNSTIIKQNNTQLQLLAQITESLKDIQDDLKTILEQTKGGIAPSSFPEDSIQKLQNLSLGQASEKQKENKGTLRVFKDPYKILKEQDKLQN